MRETDIFAQVVVPSPLKDPLVYRIPAPFLEKITPGMRVQVPLQRRKVAGIVIEVTDRHDLPQVKDIAAVLDARPILDPGQLDLARWVARYYLASMGEVLSTMLPPNSKRAPQQTVRRTGKELTGGGELEGKIVAALERRRGQATVATLARLLPGDALGPTLAKLESLGLVRLDTRRKSALEIVPSAGAAPVGSASPTYDHTAEQRGALAAIEQRIRRGGFETFLLHGVTGSGKTEVYLRAMEQVRAGGGRCLILIPEISLTPQLLDRLYQRFPGKVGVLHSALTAAERWQQWWQIIDGEIDVVVGARSAVFAPIANLRLIVVDEEHDSSYKQEDGLRYNGRDLAVVRGKLLDCPVLLGSATPALESYENCRQGRYRLLELTERVEERALPAIELIDLRQQPHRRDAKETTAAGQPRRADPPLLSPAFIDALQNNFRDRRQTLIFLNRRGFANFLQCKLCGYVWHCPQCSVTLTLHRRYRRLACHHCDHRRPATEICPECQNPSLGPVGAGTEQVEHLLHELLPEARVARMDRDTTSQRGAHEALIRRWERGDIDVLVGTQMVTKGHDVFGVTLVGALLADLSLNLPDFRAAERTFQLLSQVAGRSGRGDYPGRVIIQTYNPEHYAIQFLLEHDYRGFFEAESSFRRALGYPPYGRLVNIRMDGPKEDEIERKAKTLAAQLQDFLRRQSERNEMIEILGPAPAPIEKLRNRYRWQILLKGKQSSTLLELAARARQLWPNSRAARLHVDVDPYSML